MKKVLLSLLFVCALSAPAAATGNSASYKCRIDDHSKDVIVSNVCGDVTCAPQLDLDDLKEACAAVAVSLDCPAQITMAQITAAVSAAAPACPTVTVPACPEPTVCPEPAAPTSIEGVYQLCKLRTDGSRKCRRLGVYKLFKSDGGYEQ